jgi:hypothetical protein
LAGLTATGIVAESHCVPILALRTGTSVPPREPNALQKYTLFPIAPKEKRYFYSPAPRVKKRKGETLLMDRELILSLTSFLLFYVGKHVE